MESEAESINRTNSGTEARTGISPGPAVQSGCSGTGDKHVGGAGLSSWPTGRMASVLIKQLLF